jgi:hypothetical protein
VELALHSARRLGPVDVGVQVAVTPLAYQAVTVDRAFSRRISRLRLGLWLELPVLVAEF